MGEKTLLYRSGQERISLLAFKISVIVCGIYSVFVRKHLIYLTADQTLNIFSGMAQIVAASMGLIIATFGLTDNSDKIPEDASEAYMESRKYLFYSLIIIIILSIADIGLCLLALSVVRTYKVLFDLISTEAVVIFIFLMIRLFLFCSILNPMEIQKSSLAIKEAMNSEYKGSSTRVGYIEFIDAWNQLYEGLMRLANDIERNKNNQSVKHWYEIIRCLKSNGIINEPCVKMLSDLQRYRNALVHSVDSQKMVNKEIFEKAIRLKELFQRLVKEYFSDLNKDFLDRIKNIKNSRVYVELQKYVDENALTDYEKELLNKKLTEISYGNMTNDGKDILTQGEYTDSNEYKDYKKEINRILKYFKAFYGATRNDEGERITNLMNSGLLDYYEKKKREEEK